MPYKTQRYKFAKSFSEGLNLKENEVDKETFLVAAKLCGVDYECYEDYVNANYSAYFEDWVKEYIDNIYLESASKHRRTSIPVVDDNNGGNVINDIGDFGDIGDIGDIGDFGFDSGNFDESRINFSIVVILL